MNDDLEWGPWIDGSIPPPAGSEIRMEVTCEKPVMRFTHDARVIGLNPDDTLEIDPKLPILAEWELDRYRIRRPRALRQLIEMVENLPKPSRQREDA